MKFLKEHELRGRIFNSYGFGGYLIWHLWPDIPVFIDGRTPTVYDQDFFWLYGSVERKQELWKKVAERYQIDIVLAHDIREIGYASFLYLLDNDENWRLVAFDDVSTLYLKKGAKFDELIKKYEFHFLGPSDLSMDYAKGKRGDTKYLKALEREINEACQRSPRDFYPFYYLGVYHQIYGTKEHLLEAEKAFRKAVANRPYSPRGYYELGFTLMKLERYDETVKAMKKSIRLSNRGPADAYYYLGVSLFHKGKLDAAIKFLEKYKEKVRFETRVEAYKFLGRAYLQRHKLRKALSCFKREEYLGHPTWETYVNMGVAYFGLDSLEEAKESFERAMEMEPEEIKVIYNLAVTYEKLSLFERSRDLFRKLAGMEPKNPEEKVWVGKAKNKIVKMTD